MDGLTHTALHTEAMIARFRAERTRKRTGADGARAYTNASGASNGRVQTDTGANAQERVDLRGRVEISVKSTSATVNRVLNDSVVEQINKAIQEAGIDLKVEADGSFEVSPEGTARRIADFATSHHEAYEMARASEPVTVRLSGFMSLIRGAIQEGFQEAKAFFSDVANLSDTLMNSIDKTFELTKGYLSDFEAAQQAAKQQSNQMPEVESQEGANL